MTNSDDAPDDPVAEAAVQLTVTAVQEEWDEETAVSQVCTAITESLEEMQVFIDDDHEDLPRLRNFVRGLYRHLVTARARYRAS
jgi:hypothetical protein